MSREYLGQFTQVISNTAVNEFKVGLCGMEHPPGQPDHLVESLGEATSA